MEVLIVIAMIWLAFRGMALGYPLMKRLVEAAATRIEQREPPTLPDTNTQELADAVHRLEAEVMRLREEQQFLERLLEGSRGVEALPSGGEWRGKATGSGSGTST